VSAAVGLGVPNTVKVEGTVAVACIAEPGEVVEITDYNACLGEGAGAAERKSVVGEKSSKVCLGRLEADGMDDVVLAPGGDNAGELVQRLPWPGRGAERYGLTIAHGRLVPQVLSEHVSAVVPLVVVEVVAVKDRG
jgi:hypothetical protein